LSLELDLTRSSTKTNGHYTKNIAATLRPTRNTFCHWQYGGVKAIKCLPYAPTLFCQIKNLTINILRALFFKFVALNWEIRRFATR
jgi:hypothetical protein